MNTTNPQTTIKSKLKEPFTIYSIISFINYIVLLIIFLVTPIWKKIDTDVSTDSYVYWNSYYNMYSRINGTLIETGYDETYLKGPTILLFIVILLMLICTLSQIFSLLFSKNLTRKKFLSIFIWPNFILNALMMISVFTFVNYSLVIVQRISEKLFIINQAAITYGMILSIFTVVLAIIFVAIFSSKNRMKSYN